MKKILFVIHQLNFGGAQRVLINIMNNIDRDKYKVELVVFQERDELANTINNDILIHKLNVSNIRKGIFKLYKLINTINPNIVFSGIAHVNLMLAVMIPFLPKHIKYIARETSIPSQRLKNSQFKFFTIMLYKYFYNNYDLIISQSNYMKTDLIDNFDTDNNKIVVINNPVDIDKINKSSSTKEILFDKNKINIIVVGRLEEVKGYDLLIQAFAQLNNNFELYLIGDGSQKETLFKLTQSLNIIQRIHFLGFQDNPYKYMAQADLMVLSSRYEGFPNVVLEANACGLPVVAYECPGGTGEIIINGLNGFLVECGDIEKLADKIKEAKAYQWDKEKIVENIDDKYSLKNIIFKYEDLL